MAVVMGRYDALMSNLPFRMLLVLGGVVVGLIGLVLLGKVIHNYVGRGALKDRRDLENVASAQFHGDLDRAAAHIRTFLPMAVMWLLAACHLIFVGVLGSEPFGGPNRPLWFAVLGVVAWWIAERELAWPGLLLPPAVRGTRGLVRTRFSRR